MRESFGSKVRFMLMNSFSTSADTLEFLKKYAEISADPNLELVQVRPRTSNDYGYFWGLVPALARLGNICLKLAELRVVFF